MLKQIILFSSKRKTMQNYSTFYFGAQKTPSIYVGHKANMLLHQCVPPIRSISSAEQVKNRKKNCM